MLFIIGTKRQLSQKRYNHDQVNHEESKNEDEHSYDDTEQEQEHEEEEEERLINNPKDSNPNCDGTAQIQGEVEDKLK